MAKLLKYQKREIVEWVINYLLVDEVSRAFNKSGPGWHPKKQAVGWRVEQKAREVVAEGTEAQKTATGRMNSDWKKDLECFTCGKKGHIRGDAECPGWGAGKGKGK